MRLTVVLIHTAITIAYLMAFVLWARSKDIHDALGLQAWMFTVAVAHLAVVLLQSRSDRSGALGSSTYKIAAVIVLLLNLWTCTSAPKVFL